MLFMLAYGDEHRAGRKLIHACIGTRAALRRFEDMEEIETRRFLYRVMKNPQNLTTYLRM